jgi:hypothetical protein
MERELRNANGCSTTARTDDSRWQTSSDATAAALKITLNETIIPYESNGNVPDTWLTGSFHKN